MKATRDEQRRCIECGTGAVLDYRMMCADCLADTDFGEAAPSPGG